MSIVHGKALCEPNTFIQLGTALFLPRPARLVGTSIVKRPLLVKFAITLPLAPLLSLACRAKLLLI